MIRKRAGQRTFSDAILFGAHIPDPKTLLDPVLRQLDGVLDSDELVDEVLDALRKRHPQSSRRGRPGTPAEVALRLLVLKHVRQWSFEELQWEVTGNVAYRAFCRIDSGKVPDAKTMIRINQAVDEATLALVKTAIAKDAGGASKADVLGATGLSESDRNKARTVLLGRGEVSASGQKRGTRYHTGARGERA